MSLKMKELWSGAIPAFSQSSQYSVEIHDRQNSSLTWKIMYKVNGAAVRLVDYTNAGITAIELKTFGASRYGDMLIKTEENEIMTLDTAQVELLDKKKNNQITNKEAKKRWKEYQKQAEQYWEKGVDVEGSNKLISDIKNKNFKIPTFFSLLNIFYNILRPNHFSG